MSSSFATAPRSGVHRHAVAAVDSDEGEHGTVELAADTLQSECINLLQRLGAKRHQNIEPSMDAIHDKAPQETVGRNTIARFRMQFQAAAYAALEILTGKEVDRVYCDYHDDFVVRRTGLDPFPRTL